MPAKPRYAPVDDEQVDELEREDDETGDDGADDLGDLPPLDQIGPPRPRRPVEPDRIPSGPAYPSPVRPDDDDDDDEGDDFTEALLTPFEGAQKPQKEATPAKSIVYRCVRPGMNNNDFVEIWGRRTERVLRQKLWANYPEFTTWQVSVYGKGKRNSLAFLDNFDVIIENDPTAEEPTPAPTLTMRDDGSFTPKDVLGLVQNLAREFRDTRVNPAPVQAPAPKTSFWDHIDKVIALGGVVGPIVAKVLGAGADVAKAQMEGIRLGMDMVRDAESPNWKSMLAAMVPALPYLAAGAMPGARSAAGQAPPLPEPNAAEAPQLPAQRREATVPPPPPPKPNGSEFVGAHLAIGRTLNDPSSRKHGPNYWAFELMHGMSEAGVETITRNTPEVQAALYEADLKSNGVPVPADHVDWWRSFYVYWGQLLQQVTPQEPDEEDDDGPV